jgi:hypothetical protein
VPENPRSQRESAQLFFIARGSREAKRNFRSRKFLHQHGHCDGRNGTKMEAKMELELHTLNDEQLRQFNSEIEAELSARDKKRKAEAAAQIKAMAESAGLSVSITEKGARKRGRPSKSASSS